MGNRIFTTILEEKIDLFKYAFKESSKSIFYDETLKRLIHPGEFGTHREQICKEYLRSIIPMRLELGSGFIITDTGDVSTQIDIIIYDRNSTPLIENSEKQRFYPVETVVGIIEVKSDLSKTELKTALNKLANNKKLKEKMSSPTSIRREAVGKFDPTYPYDNIFSVLICNKLNFNLDNLTNEIDTYYNQDILPRHKHNLILSVEDGILSYFDNIGKSLMYPVLVNQLKNRFTKPNTNLNTHFHIASSYIFLGTSSASIYYPEISNYINFTQGINLDQN
ncbi:DUF6602 domain-containing protein [Flavobacterium panici]|uniref:DUF6602 domain-containing protein n=1 Tax=Flavobacterium panici TaxID=2654843 RepID=A0A9N8J2L3_9FLAO|nr:DUF6602 domain-containing protein [Flavobacterium panici]CAC9974234.1 hypothetical protein FLAPXU55_01931 [Flavobacterium panici]